MTYSEIWLTYVFASRALAGKEPATQILELEYQGQKLHDLEDVLDHIFRQGYVEAKHRPSVWWEKHDGVKVKGSHVVEELLEQGVGRCEQTALKLVIEDVPQAIWFSYIHPKNAAAPVVTQRIKFHAQLKLEKLAHITNHVFGQGYLPANLRPFVRWEGVCGKVIHEHVSVSDLLTWGEGICEDKAIRLVIDEPHATHHTHSECQPQPHHSPCESRPQTPHCVPRVHTPHPPKGIFTAPRTPSTPGSLATVSTPTTVYTIAVPYY